MSLSLFMLAISAAAALGGLLFGFDTAVISGAIPFIKNAFGLEDYALGWAVSSVLVGCTVGAVFAGKLADRLGRRRVLLVCAWLFALSGVGAALANGLTEFAIFRFVGGLGVGAAALVSPMYIAEAAPASWRGRLVTLYQLAIVSGILLAYFSNYLFATQGPASWRWMFGAQLLPAAIFWAALLFVPETPRWLLGQGRRPEALRVLIRTLGAIGAHNALQVIERSMGSPIHASIAEALLPVYRRVLMQGVLVAIFQQVTGINAILYYTPVILAKTGLDTSSSLFQAIALGIVNFIATLGALLWVDRAGRKRLLLMGSAIMGLSLAGVAICFHFQYYRGYLILIGVLLYVATFAATLGAVTWVYLSEIFPNRIRAIGLSIATLFLWLADFAVTYTFPIMTERLSAAATLSCYAVLCAVSFGYVFFKVPETMGRSLEEIEMLFVR